MLRPQQRDRYVADAAGGATDDAFISGRRAARACHFDLTVYIRICTP
jgi:hypothetical protein